MLIPIEFDNTRLDKALTVLLDLSRSQVKKKIQANEIHVNGTLPKKAGDIVMQGDKITITASVKKEQPKKIEIPVDTTLIPTVIKETADYLVINKPSGLLSHPTQANEAWSLSHWVWSTYPDIDNIGEYENRPGIVHRLDKDTSGLMVIARTQTMFDHLKEQFKNRTVDKNYTALVHGEVDRNTNIIDFDIDRGSDGKMVSRPKTDPLRLKNIDNIQPGKSAKTEFFVEDRFSRYTLLSVKIYTGRTHQIRVHLFAYGFPVVGDPLYTNTKLNRSLDKKLDRIFLHSHSLSFLDLDKKTITTTSELPKKLTDILEQLT